MVIVEVAIKYLVITIICNLGKLIRFITMQKYMYYENDEADCKAFLILHHQFNKATYILNTLVLHQHHQVYIKFYFSVIHLMPLMPITSFFYQKNI